MLDVDAAPAVDGAAALWLGVVAAAAALAAGAAADVVDVLDADDVVCDVDEECVGCAARGDTSVCGCLFADASTTSSLSDAGSNAIPAAYTIKDKR